MTMVRQSKSFIVKALHQPTVDSENLLVYRADWSTLKCFFSKHPFCKMMSLCISSCFLQQENQARGRNITSCINSCPWKQLQIVWLHWWNSYIGSIWNSCRYFAINSKNYRNLEIDLFFGIKAALEIIVLVFVGTEIFII